MGRRGVIVLAMALFAAACSVNRGSDASCATPFEEPTTHRYATIDGVASELNSLDVYASPTAENCPVLVWVHGGAWQLGDKETRATTVKAEHFVSQGFVFVSVNYRLAANDNDVRWPDFGDDVAAAVSWIIENGHDIGADPAKASVIGHSSGAHLVSIVATNPDLLGANGHRRSDLTCIISLDSVSYDLTDEPRWETDIIELAFPTLEAKQDGSPTLEAVAHPVGADGPPFLVVTRGRPQRLESSRDLAEAIIDGGGRADVVDVSPYDHRQVNLQLGVADEAVITPVVDDFLRRCR